MGGPVSVEIASQSKACAAVIAPVWARVSFLMAAARTRSAEGLVCAWVNGTYLYSPRLVKVFEQDWQAMGALAPAIKREFGSKFAGIGFIVAADVVKKPSRDV